MREALLFSCLHLYVKKQSVCLPQKEQVMFLNNSQFMYQVRSFKYIVLDSTLLQKTSQASCCKNRNQLKQQGAKSYFHALIFSHVSCCLTAQSLTTDTVIKPVPSVEKQALKVWIINLKAPLTVICSIFRT